jgi:hypothetical protein
MIAPSSREPNPEHDTLVPYILRDAEHDSGLCYEFFQEALSRFDEDDTIEPLFTKTMVDVSSQLSTLSMNDGYKPYMTVSRSACAHLAMTDGVLTSAGFDYLFQVSEVTRRLGQASAFPDGRVGTEHRKGYYSRALLPHFASSARGDENLL